MVQVPATALISGNHGTQAAVLDNSKQVVSNRASWPGFKHHLVAVIEDRGLRTMVARDKRRGRYLHHVWVARDLELYLAIRTGGEFLAELSACSSTSMLREGTFNAFEVVTSFASKCWPGYCGISKVAFSPG